MKKISLLLSLAAALLSQNHNAQASSIGNTSYGRIFDLTYDVAVENKVYAVTLMNHIVVSNDNGESWDLLFSLPYNKGFRIAQLKLINDGKDLSFVSRDYLGGADKINIFNLQNKAITKSITLPNESDNAYVMSYNFSNDQQALIVNTNWRVDLLTVHNKVFVTYDNASTWKEIYFSEDHDKTFVNNTLISPNNPSNLFLLRAINYNSEGGGLLSSTNQGDTWETLLTGKPYSAIEVNPSNPLDLYIGTDIVNSHEDEGLYNSKDGGKTWSLIPINWDSTGVQNNIGKITINPQNPNHIIVLEENEVATSFDSGQNWEKTTYIMDNLDQYYGGQNLSINPFSQNEVLVTGNYKPVLLKNGGRTFEKQIKTSYFGALGNIGINTTNGKRHLYYPVQYGWVHKDLATGEEKEFNIKPLDYFGTNQNSQQFIDKNKEGRIYNYSSGMMGKTLTYSDTHGANPKTISYAYADNVATVVSDPSNTNIIWASFIIRDENYNAYSELYKIDITDPNNTTEETINLPTSEETITTILFPNKNNGKEIFIATLDRIYKSINGGSSWELLDTSAISDTIFELSANPLDPNQLAMATSGGVYITKDSGATWQKKTNEEVRKVIFSTVQNGKIIALNSTNEDSQGFSLYYTTNTEDWTRLNDQDLGYLMNVAADIEFTENNAKIYIATYDLGVVLYNLNLENLGTDNPSINKDIYIVYPNPTTGNITIKTNKVIEQSLIYNTNGSLILTTDRKTIDLSKLTTGVYIIKTIYSDKSIMTKKIIKK